MSLWNSFFIGLQCWPLFSYICISQSMHTLCSRLGREGCNFKKCAFGACQRSRNTLVCNNLWGLDGSCKHASGSKTHLLKTITNTTTTTYSVPGTWGLPYRSLFLEMVRENNRRGKHISRLQQMPEKTVWWNYVIWESRTLSPKARFRVGLNTVSVNGETWICGNVLQVVFLRQWLQKKHQIDKG